MPIIPVTILTHKIWVFVDSGATFTVLGVDEAYRLGIDWQRGRRPMIVVGDGSFIPIYMHDLSIHIDAWEITAPVGFSELTKVPDTFSRSPSEPFSFPSLQSTSGRRPALHSFLRPSNTLARETTRTPAMATLLHDLMWVPHFNMPLGGLASVLCVSVLPH